MNHSPLTYTVTAKPWLFAGANASWHFITIPKSLSLEMLELFGSGMRPFGTLPVKATIGKTTWNTSIFRSKKSDEYLLPLKAVVRKKENLQERKELSVELTIVQ